MWIRRGEYQRLLAQIQQTEEGSKVTIDEIKSEVAKALQDAEALIAKRESEAASLVAKAEHRVAEVEVMLATERRENRRAERHWASMFLRREKTFPLPPTKEEKVEAEQEVEKEKSRPRPLNEVELSMKMANRAAAAQMGISEEQADRDFESKILNRMME